MLLRRTTTFLLLLSTLYTLFIWYTGGPDGEGAIVEMAGRSPSYITPIYTAFNRLGSFFPATLIWLALVLLAYNLWGRRAGVFLLATVAHLPTSQILKYTVGRVRPSGLPLSYPSGHVMFYCAVVGGFIYLWGRGGGWRRHLSIILFTLIFILSSLARLYSGAHWPTDTLGSLLLSLTLLSLLHDLLLRPEPGDGGVVME